MSKSNGRLVKLKINVNPLYHAHMREILHRKRTSNRKNRNLKLAHIYVDAVHKFFNAIEQNPDGPQDFIGDRSLELRLQVPEFLIPHRDDLFEMVMRWYIALPENYLGKTFAENLEKRMQSKTQEFIADGLPL